MLTEKLQIFTRIYKQFDPSFSLICYYSFIFGLLRITIGISIFGFIANEYQRRAIWLLLTIHNIWSAIRWAIPKVILNYSRLPRPKFNFLRISGAPLQGRFLAFPTHIRLGWKSFPGTNTLANYEKSVNYGHKKFYRISPSCIK